MIHLKAELVQKKKAQAVYRWLTWLSVIPMGFTDMSRSCVRPVKKAVPRLSEKRSLTR